MRSEALISSQPGGSHRETSLTKDLCVPVIPAEEFMKYEILHSRGDQDRVSGRIRVGRFAVAARLGSDCFHKTRNLIKNNNKCVDICI